MEGDRTTREAIESFMQSEFASTVIRDGSGTTFRGEIEAFIRELTIDRWEGDLDYLNVEVLTFIEQMTDAGYLEAPRPDDMGLWDELKGVVEVGLEARYAAEVSEGRREDMRTPAEEARDDGGRAEPSSLTERVQSLMQTVKEFVRGHEAETPARGQDLER